MRRATADRAKSFPLALKIVYSVFVCFHVFFNWRAYGPLNFLWECDVAILTVLVALWTNSRLLTSVVALAALVPMGLWIVDLAARIALGHYLFGFAGYMFDRKIPLVIRVISAFHVWLPPVLLWMVYHVGYDRRAIYVQTVFVAVLMITCKLVSKPPPPHSMHEAVNINWVYGPSDDAPQTKMSPNAFLALLIVLYPLLIYMPTHLLLELTLSPRKPRDAKSGSYPAAIAL